MLALDNSGILDECDADPSLTEIIPNGSGGNWGYIILMIVAIVAATLEWLI